MPSRLGLLLNISPRHLERVLYFAQYIITNVNEDARSRAIQRHERELAMRLTRIDNEVADQINGLENQLEAALGKLDEEEEQQVRVLDDQINEESSKLIDEAQRCKPGCRPASVKRPTTTRGSRGRIRLIIQKDEVISRDHEMFINDLVQEKLNELRASRMRRRTTSAC